MAPFNRYASLDVARAIAEAGRADSLALYTGNDDNIFVDLLTTFRLGKEAVPVRGGLLGQWAVWTQAAVLDFRILQHLRQTGAAVPAEIFTRAAHMTEVNAAVFDAANGFAGCIVGIHEVLRRQGLLENLVTLDPAERLSPGQAEALDRVQALYPDLTDDPFVAEHRDMWLSG